MYGISKSCAHSDLLNATFILGWRNLLIKSMRAPVKILRLELTLKGGLDVQRSAKIGARNCVIERYDARYPIPQALS